MPVRKVAHIGKNIVGKFPSLKEDRMIAFESTVERDFLYLLEFDAEVERFEEQPLTIEYGLNGKLYGYTPDFKVTLKEGVELVECKPASQVNDPRNEIKFIAAAQWCRERDWQFEVVTDRELRAGHFLSNVKVLFRHARRLVPAETLYQAERFLRNKPRRLRELATKISLVQPALAEADLMCLAFHHKIGLDMTTAPLTGNVMAHRIGDEP